ncbi:MAG TPA: hypothetical protein VF599_16450 [Pyrinomonadaceae bacterium]|jgi:ribosomal protein L40E
MAFGKKKHRVREKSCRQCFAYIPADSRKCKFCGYTLKSSGKYLADKIKKVLRIDRAFSISREKPQPETQNFFTAPEIEKLARLNDFHILMFLRLDDISLLDEMALIELGETLMMLNKR